METIKEILLLDQQETLEEHKQSAYLREKIEQLSESKDGETQLRELMRLRDIIIYSKMSYRSEAMG